MQLPKFLAHRGAAFYAPENTLAAMRLARALGATWVEFDVELSKDGEAVVIHDETVDRTTDGQGKVADFTLQELQALDAGAWFGNEYMGECIPTLSELLKTLDEVGLKMNLEIKPNTPDHQTLIQKILEALDTVWPRENPLPLISSFDWRCLKAFKKAAPQFPVALLMHQWTDEWRVWAQAVEAVSIHLNQEIVTQERVQAIKKLGYGILSYTVNDLARAEMFWRWGVDGIFTDDVKAMPLEFLEPPEEGEDTEQVA